MTACRVNGRSRLRGTPEEAPPCRRGASRLGCVCACVFVCGGGAGVGGGLATPPSHGTEIGEGARQVKTNDEEDRYFRIRRLLHKKLRPSRT